MLPHFLSEGRLIQCPMQLATMQIRRSFCSDHGYWRKINWLGPWMVPVSQKCILWVTSVIAGTYWGYHGRKCRALYSCMGKCINIFMRYGFKSIMFHNHVTEPRKTDELVDGARMSWLRSSKNHIAGFVVIIAKMRDEHTSWAWCDLIFCRKVAWFNL